MRGAFCARYSAYYDSRADLVPVTCLGGACFGSAGHSSKAMGERMLYDKLWNVVVRIDWYVIAVAFAISSFVLAAKLTWNTIRIRKHIGTIGDQLSEIQKQITTVLQIQTALITKRSARSEVEIDPSDTAVEIGGGDVAGPMMFHSTPSTH